MFGCATLCERTGAGAEERWELCCGLRRGGVASEDGTEEGGGGNCCRGSGLGGKTIGEVKPTELMLSLTETGWFSTGREGLSFPGGATELGSVLIGWMAGCEIGPTDC